MPADGFCREMKPAFELFGMERSHEELASLHRRCVKPQMNHSREAHAACPKAVADRWRELLERHGRSHGSGGAA